MVHYDTSPRAIEWGHERLTVRGIDDAAYYRLVEDDRRRNLDYSGYGTACLSIRTCSR